MVAIWSFTLAVIFVVINGATQLYYAQSLGYKLKPTAFAYFVGAIGNLLTGSVVPISGQAETLTVSGLIKNLHERVGALLIAAAVGIILGLTGGVSAIAGFAGNTVVSGMMAGVGFILSIVAIELYTQEKRTGIISIIVALLMWKLTHDVVYTIAASVFVSSLDYCLLQRRRVDLKQVAQQAGIEPESPSWKFWEKAFWSDWKLLKPTFGIGAIIGGLSFICLNIGSNISFGNITASIAGADAKLNALSVINSLADVPSILFGGMPIEAIISGTAGAPWPVAAAVAMMALSGILLLTGVIGKLGKFIPAQSISGFLLVIGFLLTIMPNMGAVISSETPTEGIVACGVTVITKNAFAGLVAGTLVRLTGNLFGIL
jgi:AGZA family xanthine/uracil permease-like MFS transporter